MKHSKLLNVVLVMSGLISVIVGAGMLFFPVEFHATSGIALGESTNLINEMRAAGGPLFVGGAIIMSGAFVTQLTFTATLMASAFYLSYGCARIVSFVMDGMPSVALVQITAFELLVGLISTAALLFFFERETAWR